MVLNKAIPLLALLLIGISPAEAKTADLPRFENFVASVQQIDKQAVPAFGNKNDPYLQAAISAAVAKEQPTFAGHYTVAMTGCGTGCVTGSIVDLITGKIVNFPFSVICKSRIIFIRLSLSPIAG